MAIILKEFRKSTYKAGGKTIEVLNLYESIEEHPVKGRKYLARFRLNNTTYAKILGYSKKNGTNFLTPKKAQKLLEEYKRELEGGYTSTNKITLDKLFEYYYKTLDTSKQWTDKKKYIYNHYIGTFNEDAPEANVERRTETQKQKQKIFNKYKIGKKQLKNIREMDIRAILNNMNKMGLSPRTVKSVMEVLNPLFRFANVNKYLKDDPANGIKIKIPSQKKLVIDGEKMLTHVFDGINAYYKDNPFYRALFLFGWVGRRKGEILNLKWENIDFTHRYYWIEDTKTDDQQKYKLPEYLISALNEIQDERKGLVFKSPVTGKKIVNIDRQTKQLKKFLELETFSLHYMRNIVASGYGEKGIPSIVISGVLGHKDPNTINKYLSINHYKSSQIGLEKVNSIIGA